MSGEAANQSSLPSKDLEPFLKAMYRIAGTLLMQKIRAIGPTVRAGEALKDKRTDGHIRKQYI